MKKLISTLALAAALASPAAASDGTMLYASGEWSVWFNTTPNGGDYCSLESYSASGTGFVGIFADGQGFYQAIYTFDAPGAKNGSTPYRLEVEVDQEGAWITETQADVEDGIILIDSTFGSLTDLAWFLADISGGQWLYVQTNSDTPRERVLHEWSLEGSYKAVGAFSDCMSRIVPWGDPS